MSNRPPSRLRRAAPTVLASAMIACTLIACGSPSAADDPDQVSSPNQGIVAGTLEARVDRAAQTLSLRNTTAFEVGYMVIEKDMMTVALMPPCGNNCPIVVQGASATVAYNSIAGYTAQAKEARVLWWTYKRNADGTRTTQGGVNSVTVTL